VFFVTSTISENGYQLQHPNHTMRVF